MELSLEKFINDQFDFLKSHISGKAKKFSKVEIHDLRLSFKKLKSVAFLLEMLLPEKADAQLLMEPLLPLYKKMGQLRDVQVMQTMLSNYEESLGIELQPVVAILKQQIKSVEFEVFDYMEEFKLKGKKKFLKRVKQIEDNLDKSEIVEISNETIQQLISGITRKLLSNKISDESYHDIRKYLKTIGYIYKLLNKDLDRNDLMIKPKWTKPIEKELGDWHDKIVLRDFLLEIVQNESETEISNDDELQEIYVVLNSIEVEIIQHLKLFRVHFDKLIIELEERL
jgi:CHAD domain-containing protein